MEYRVLGGTSLTVSRVGIGCARLGGVFSEESPATSLGMLKEAISAGINYFDTADIYSQGESERILGAAIRGRRGDIIVASKAGYVLPTQRVFADRVKPLLRPLARRLGVSRTLVPTIMRGSVSRQEFSADYLLHSVTSSLRRLKTDYLDVFMLHSPPRELLQSGEFDETCTLLRDRGLIREFGVSCEHVDDADAALAIAGVSCVQLPLSALEPQALVSAIPNAVRAGKGVVARQCYASGLLSRIQPTGPSGQARSPDAADQELRLTQVAREAAFANRELGEYALGFSVLNSFIDVTLIGVRTPQQLEGNLRWLGRLAPGWIGT